MLLFCASLFSSSACSISIQFKLKLTSGGRRRRRRSLTSPKREQERQHLSTLTSSQRSQPASQPARRPTSGLVRKKNNCSIWRQDNNSFIELNLTEFFFLLCFALLYFTLLCSALFSSADSTARIINKPTEMNPKQHWDFVPIYESLRYSILSNGSLAITNATQRDQGYFVCTASNGFKPEASKLIKISIHGEY